MQTRQQRRRPVVAVVSVALASAGALAPTTAQADEPDVNLVANGTFDPGVHGQWWGVTDDDVTDGELCLDVPATERFGNFVDLGLEAGTDYRLGFTVHGDPGTAGLEARVQADGASGPEGFDVAETFTAGPEPQQHEWGFTATGDAQRVQFELSGADPGSSVCLDDVYVTPVAHVAQNPRFDGLAPWWTTPNLDLVPADGRMCGTVPAGGNQWDVILGQGGIALEAGRPYTVTVTASGAPESAVRLLVPQPGTDWPPAYFADLTLRADGQSFGETFEVDEDIATEIQLQLGGNPEPFELCLDEVSLTTGGTVEEFEHDTGPRVRVNQLGYMPDGPKRATVVTEATDPLPWELHDAGGAVVAAGETTPAGLDESAGLEVHTADFTDVSAVGEGFRLVADGEESYPFAIAADLYEPLRDDALGIYYTQRSGYEITPVEIDGEEHKTEYVRPAGHVSEFGADDVNQGDLGVPCLPPDGAVNHEGAPQLGADDHYGADGWVCPDGYAVDAAGGWYDAGDHGKYVVNSGIAVYQLLSTYERSLHAGTVNDGALGDSTLVVPERDNGVPDVLDEVRWNLEWMLRMQVADGVTMTIDGDQVDAGGLVHHKLHDIAWTGLNTLPHEDPMPRYVHRPSTAATLNLAAAAAQGARLYAEHDEAFADELLAAARAAWEAAGEHPEIYAPNTNDLDPNPGGGPYDDTEVGDELYWAAAQLFLTTGEDEFAAAVLGSPYHVGGEQADVFSPTGYDWGRTAVPARLDLATVPNTLPGRADVVDSVLAGADGYVTTQESQPFGHAYAPGDYEWGSTAQVINNAVVLATAYDLSGDVAYRDAALETFDYILGRNAINNSYVTGYGSHFSQQMHSRWYASADRLPPFPEGKIAGGPNSGLQDPVAQANLQGCAPQACYIDHVDSWSTNETTINWNAALAWYASWAADMGSASPDDWAPPTPTCAVDYTVHGSWPGGFVAQVWVTNLGPGDRDGWELGWRFDGDQGIRDVWGGDVAQDGAAVTLTNAPWNARMDDSGWSATRTFGFVGRSAGATDHVPQAFTLDGMWCAVS